MNRPSRNAAALRVPSRTGAAARGILATLLGLVLAGCGSTPPAPPPAVAEADRIAAQAARLQREENWAGAAEWWFRAGRQYQLLNRQGDVALARHNEGIARRSLGQYGVAHALLDEAARANRNLGRTNAWWRNQIALVQLDAEIDPTAAANRLNELSPLAEQLRSDPSLLGLVRHEEARLKARQGAFAEALAAADLAATAFRAAAEPTGEAAVLLTRARILQARGDAGSAIAVWREALTRFEQAGHPRGVAVSLAGLGTSLADGGGSVAEAREILRRAEENLAALKMEAEAQAVSARLKSLGDAPSGTR